MIGISLSLPGVAALNKGGGVPTPPAGWLIIRSTTDDLIKVNDANLIYIREAA